MFAQVYSCGYDQLVTTMVESCVHRETDLDAIPYFPAPDSAPGSCSCNQGKLYLTQLKILDHQNATITNTTTFEEITDPDEQRLYLKSTQCCTNAYLQSSYVYTLHIALIPANTLLLVFEKSAQTRSRPFYLAATCLASRVPLVLPKKIVPCCCPRPTVQAIWDSPQQWAMTCPPTIPRTSFHPTAPRLCTTRKARWQRQPKRPLFGRRAQEKLLSQL